MKGDTSLYLYRCIMLLIFQRMEEEKRRQETGQVPDNRSFLAKYWMYIVPIVIFMAINGAAAPEGS